MTAACSLSTTRTSYDTVAVDYASLLAEELAAEPLGHAMLGAFAEHVAADGGGPVADLGCGPGRVTAYLRDTGPSAFGIDLSPGMVAEARRRHPDLRFDVGTMSALDLAAGSLRGALARYSLTHTPPEELGPYVTEFHRVLAPAAICCRPSRWATGRSGWSTRTGIPWTSTCSGSPPSTSPSC